MLHNQNNTNETIKIVPQIIAAAAIIESILKFASLESPLSMLEVAFMLTLTPSLIPALIVVLILVLVLVVALVTVLILVVLMVSVVVV